MDDAAAVIITGLVVWLVELAKRLGLDRFYVPALACGLGGLLSALWCYFLQPGEALLSAVKEGLLLGAVAGGLYGFGRAALGRKE
ncbi:MAG: hypothetical protein ACUVTU_12825 [Desulfurispora sp.]|uniref:hypothetical protein n=1 Tax=Desulfurispora sp. TaxID=3014275 RepID=UPI00404918FA